MASLHNPLNAGEARNCLYNLDVSIFYTQQEDIRTFELDSN